MNGAIIVRAIRKLNITRRSPYTHIYKGIAKPLYCLVRKRKTDFQLLVQKTAMSNTHFWDDDACATELMHVLRRSDSEDSARNTWTDIARHSYPDREVIDDETVLWKGSRELWPRPDGHSDLDPQKPAAMVVRCVRKRRGAAANAATTTGDAPMALKYDRLTWLIMEVKAARQDTAEKWKELLLQACSRAATGYGAHDVYIICAVGLKYMLFSWDPTKAGIAAQEMRINVAGETTHFPSQLKPAPESSPHVPKLGVASDPDQYVIDLDKVWNIDPRQIDAQGRAPEPFTALEDFLARTRTVGLVNPRPDLD
jgi:hypothetical protein